VNASVSPLPREEEVQSKIQKIRSFGRNARSVCAVLMGLTLILIAVVLVVVLLPNGAAGPSISGNVYEILSSPVSPLLLKMWVLVGVVVGIGVWLAALLQLHRLFGSLATGAIYTSENVRRVRNVGLLALLWAVGNIVFPATRIVAHGFISAPVPMDLDRVFPSSGEIFTSFATAGLVLLVSWIMDVGLYEKQHADALRHDADLVI
jgi:multisubunit Na+/H+ antiporter MnhC subunit